MARLNHTIFIPLGDLKEFEYFWIPRNIHGGTNQIYLPGQALFLKKR